MGEVHCLLVQTKMETKVLHNSYLALRSLQVSLLLVFQLFPEIPFSCFTVTPFIHPIWRMWHIPFPLELSDHDQSFGGGTSGVIRSRRGVQGCNLERMQELSAHCWSSASSGSLLMGFSDFGSIFFCAEYYCPLHLHPQCMEEDIRVLTMEEECSLRVFPHVWCFVTLLGNWGA